jgi:hypothetical protein
MQLKVFPMLLGSAVPGCDGEHLRKCTRAESQIDIASELNKISRRDRIGEMESLS